MFLLYHHDNILKDMNQHIFLLISILIQGMKDNFLRLIHYMLNNLNHILFISLSMILFIDLFLLFIKKKKKMKKGNEQKKNLDKFRYECIHLKGIEYLKCKLYHLMNNSQHNLYNYLTHNQNMENYMLFLLIFSFKNKKSLI